MGGGGLCQRRRPRCLSGPRLLRAGSEGTAPRGSISCPWVPEIIVLGLFFFLPFPSGIGAVGPRVLTVARRGGGGKERSAAQRTAARAGLRAPLLGAQSCAAAARLVPEPPLCSEPFVRRVRGPSEPFRAPPRCGGIPARPGAARGLQAVCLGKGVGCAGCSGLGGLPGWLSAPCGGVGDVGSSKGGPVVLWVNCGFSKRSGMPWSLGACSQLDCWFHRAV